MKTLLLPGGMVLILGRRYLPVDSRISGNSEGDLLWVLEFSTRLDLASPLWIGVPKDIAISQARSHLKEIVSQVVSTYPTKEAWEKSCSLIPEIRRLAQEELGLAVHIDDRMFAIMQIKWNAEIEFTPDL